MPRRWGKIARYFAYHYLVLRDGEHCARCFEIPTPQNTLYGTLDIDHIDGDPQNGDPQNLRLLCHPCNVLIENQRRRGEASLPSDQKERERSEGQPATRVIKEAVNYRQGAPEMQANFLFEVDFRDWLLKKVREGGNGFPKADAINAGAEIVGCSPTTTLKYLAKLTSSAGPLIERKDYFGDLMLAFKDHLQPEPTTLINLDERGAK